MHQIIPNLKKYMAMQAIAKSIYAKLILQRFLKCQF